MGVFGSTFGNSGLSQLGTLLNYIVTVFSQYFSGATVIEEVDGTNYLVAYNSEGVEIPYPLVLQEPLDATFVAGTYSTSSAQEFEAIATSEILAIDHLFELFDFMGNAFPLTLQELGALSFVNLSESGGIATKLEFTETTYTGSLDISDAVLSALNEVADEEVYEGDLSEEQINIAFTQLNGETF